MGFLNLLTNHVVVRADLRRSATGDCSRLAFCSRFFLSGCAPTIDFTSAEVTSFESDGDDLFRVVDEPVGNKLVITASLSRVALQEAAASTSGPASSAGAFARVGLSYFAMTGQICRLADASSTGSVRWEFRYDCSTPNGNAGPGRAAWKHKAHPRHESLGAPETIRTSRPLP